MQADIDRLHSPIWVSGWPFGRASPIRRCKRYSPSMLRPLRKNRSPAGDAASLVLRLSLTITLGVLSVSSDTGSPTISVTAAILGCLIGSGLLTRSAAVASVALISLCNHRDLIALLPIAAEGISLMLVGAGACSLDALVVHKRLGGWSYRT